jgi:hypothetical protein
VPREELIATIARVQVQRSPLEPGPRGQRVYDPAPLLEVDRAEVGPGGLVGLTDGGPVVDAHHVDHPQSRNVRGVNGVSVLPRAHCAALRERFGARAADGCAGESLQLDTVDDAVQDVMAFLADGRRGSSLSTDGTGQVAAGARLRRA